ncbi:hypothetical protein WALSEDRAFT_31786, partial [Wallemia mellicola CBS 633.66]
MVRLLGPSYGAFAKWESRGSIVGEFEAFFLSFKNHPIHLVRYFRSPTFLHSSWSFSCMTLLKAPSLRLGQAPLLPSFPSKHF